MISNPFLKILITVLLRKTLVHDTLRDVLSIYRLGRYMGKNKQVNQVMVLKLTLEPYFQPHNMQKLCGSVNRMNLYLPSKQWVQFSPLLLYHYCILKTVEILKFSMILQLKH